MPNVPAEKEGKPLQVTMQDTTASRSDSKGQEPRKRRASALKVQSSSALSKVAFFAFVALTVWCLAELHGTGTGILYHCP